MAHPCSSRLACSLFHLLPARCLEGTSPTCHYTLVYYLNNVCATRSRAVWGAVSLFTHCGAPRIFYGASLEDYQQPVKKQQM